MNFAFKTTIATLAFATAASAAHAAVLNFDDLAGVQFFVTDYRGFRFGTLDLADNAWFHTGETSPQVSPRSGANYVATDFRLYQGTSFEDAQAISNASPFRFDGAWFSGKDAVRYKLYRGGSLVFTSANSALLGPSAAFVASGYGGLIDSVVIGGTQGFYAMDDFTYGTTALPVPEPQSWALLLAGLAAVGVARRRRMG